MKKILRQIWTEIYDFFLDREPEPETPQYDPKHIASLIVVVLVSLTVLFWLLWSVMVYRGGIFTKISAGWQILFFGKKPGDFGFVRYPDDLGVFDGFITNIIATLFLLLLIFGINWLFTRTRPKG